MHHHVMSNFGCPPQMKILTILYAMYVIKHIPLLKRFASGQSYNIKKYVCMTVNW